MGKYKVSKGKKPYQRKVIRKANWNTTMRFKNIKKFKRYVSKKQLMNAKYNKQRSYKIAKSFYKFKK